MSFSNQNVTLKLDMTKSIMVTEDNKPKAGYFYESK